MKPTRIIKHYSHKECSNCGEVALIELQEWHPLEMYAYECEECGWIFERKQI